MSPQFKFQLVYSKMFVVTLVLFLSAASAVPALADTGVPFPQDLSELSAAFRGELDDEDIDVIFTPTPSRSGFLVTVIEDEKRATLYMGQIIPGQRIGLALIVPDSSGSDVMVADSPDIIVSFQVKKGKIDRVILQAQSNSFSIQQTGVLDKKSKKFAPSNSMGLSGVFENDDINLSFQNEREVGTIAVLFDEDTLEVNHFTTTGFLDGLNVFRGLSYVVAYERVESPEIAYLAYRVIYDGKETVLLIDYQTYWGYITLLERDN